jgi:hypothetical protein
MKRWIILVLLASIVGTTVWILQQQQSQATGQLTRLSVAWLDSTWGYATGPRSAAWNRRIYLKNPTDQQLVAMVYVFANAKPSTAFVEQSARSASQTIDLGPEEAVATGVWSSEDPARGVRVMAFPCSAAELGRRLQLRQRYPLLKFLWPLTYEILQVGGFTAKP